MRVDGAATYRRRLPSPNGFGVAVASEYPSGAAGIKRSVEEVVRLIQLGYSNPQDAEPLRGWLGRALIAAGRPQGVRAQVQALRDAFDKEWMYLADPVGKEWVGSAASTLCLKPDHCLPAGDCDDGTVALATITLLAGIPTKLVVQSFGPGRQQHILIGVEDESGTWLRVDPSIRGSKVGSAARAHKETWIDPMQDLAPQIVGIGRPGWHYEEKHGKRWATLDGHQWIEVGFGDAPTDLANQVNLPIQAGDTYLAAGDFKAAVNAYQAAGNAGALSVGPEIDLAGNPTQTQPLTQQAWIANVALAAINNQTPTATDAALAQSYAKKISNLYQQALTVAGAKPSTSSGIGVGSALLIALGVGTAAGLGWGLWAHSKRRRRR
jgi:hypothetical protein